MFISYAQNFEDVLLWRALGRVKNGFYIDIGAEHPEIDSVSLAFYQRGWRGAHVEPNAHYAGLLRQSRFDELVVEAAVAGPGVTTCAYFEVADSGYSTCDSSVADSHAAAGRKVQLRSVSTVTLDQVFGMCSTHEIHWLKIDVEGCEADVLRGWRSAAMRPWIVVVECVHPITRADMTASWSNELERLGYQFAYFDGLNRFYVASSHLELLAHFKCGPNVFDDFSMSGTSSASFCDAMSKKIELAYEQVDAISRTMEDQRIRLIEYAHNLRNWHNADREAWAAEQVEVQRYIDSLKEWGAGAESYAKSLEAERENLGRSTGVSERKSSASVERSDSPKE